jgi:aminoglycoside phosphotransferase (APT) family kinase protein
MRPGTSPVADEELRDVLERELGGSVYTSAAIKALERRPSPYGTSFALEELDVMLQDGSRLELVFKDAGPLALREEARLAKPELLYDPTREIEVYRGPLADARLGTATCYGAAVDAARGRYWLFIERVRGVGLNQVGELSLWRDAARWLASAHSRFAGRGAGDASERLIAHDARYYRRWIDRAREFALQGPEARRHRVESLAAAYDRAVECLLGLPATMIHGEFYASNVLASRAPEPARICPIDWEVAGFGPGLIDLAALTAGWDPGGREAMERAYRAELQAPYEWTGGEARFAEALDCARLHLAVRWLGWAPPGWTPPNEHRHDWLGEALGLADRIGS